MAHTHDVHDTGKRFEINGISRFIKETSTTKLVLVQGDHKSEVVTFEMPRYIDGHDMLLCDKIRVHYINIDTRTSDSSADIYEVTDLKLCEDCGEEETLLFTWTIEAPATKYFGSLSFLVKFECTEGDNILYQWNTARYVNVNVLNGIDNSEAFVDKYSNVLEEWYNKLMVESETVANLVETAEQQLEDCEKATNEAVTATEQANKSANELSSIKQELAEGGYVTGLKESNNGGIFKTWIGTQEEYESLETKIPNCLYMISDDKTFTDYVIEQGVTDDGWTYRKWNSGIAECWGNFRCILSWTDTATAPVILRYTASRTDINFPEGLFLGEPCVNGEFRSSGIVVTSLGAVDDTFCGFNFARVMGGSDDSAGTLLIQANGRWKPYEEVE